jgi:hypothetical protein
MLPVAVRDTKVRHGEVVERTFDTALVHSIISNPKLRAASYGTPVEAFDPNSQPEIYYLACYRGEAVIGLVIFHPFNSLACCQGHICYLPEYWGTPLFCITALAIRWIFDKTQFIKIVALIPDRYPLVLKHALHAGMKKEGYLVNSVISDGKPDNMTLLGINKWSV